MQHNISIGNAIGSCKSFILSLYSLLSPKNIVILAKDNNEIENISNELTYWENLIKQDIIKKESLENLFKQLELKSEIYANKTLLKFYGAPPYSKLIQKEHEQINFQTLFALSEHKNSKVLITTVNSMLFKFPPKDLFSKNMLSLSINENLDRDNFILKLAQMGYERTNLTENIGDFSVRGLIIDVFSPTSNYPIRIELSYDKIESLRFFDPKTQKTITHPVASHGVSNEKSVPPHPYPSPPRERVNKVQITIPKLVLMTKQTINLALKKLKQISDEHNFPKKKREKVGQAFSDKIYFDGILNFLPLFYDKTSNIFDYLLPNENYLFASDFDIDLESFAFLKKADEKFSHEKDLAIPPDLLYLTRNDFFEIEKYNHLKFNRPENSIFFEAKDVSYLRNDINTSGKQGKSPLKPLISLISNLKQQNFNIICPCKTEAQKNRLQDLLITNEVQSVLVNVGDVSNGFILPECNLAIISEQDIFGEKFIPAKKEPSTTKIDFDISDLKPANYIVHDKHGIGKFISLEKLSYQNISNDFLKIEYFGKDFLYLPVDRINIIQKYIGADGGKARLDKLGGKEWERKKQRVRKVVMAIAHDLLKLYAKRKLATGISFSPPEDTYKEFEATFFWEETADQLTAIRDVITDMEDSKPMDRLLCGDVGFGKTEVAMRAAFLAMLSQKQVCVLVPTTVLALQHENTFSERFENYPVEVAGLSRFKSKKETAQIISSLKKGQTDIIIGTHKLLTSNIQFRDLGLLIVDEEHKFGVTHKEKIKKFKENIDVLSMTATPIPRTLQMAVFGFRNLSLINTPPQDRLAITTYVVPFTDEVIKDAILNEVSRGGQVYFVHNRVSTIQNFASYLKRMLPSLRVEIAHGQMKGRQLEKIMIDFINHKFDVLLCTKIIESGLDIPNVNTIIINRADMFGLSELYQLKGRVGRSKRQAFCYLLIPEENLLTVDARKRLSALRDFSHLGSGFKLASLDLEIRGGGNILGYNQSGHINLVGYDMFVKLLKLTIKKLSGEKVEDEIEPEIILKISAHIPNDYVPDSDIRFDIYKKLGQVMELSELKNVRNEIYDRFGPIPSELDNLLKVIEIKYMARKLKIEEIELGIFKSKIKFSNKSSIDINKITKLVTKRPEQYQLDPSKGLIIKNAKNDIDETFTNIKNILKDI